MSGPVILDPNRPPPGAGGTPDPLRVMMQGLNDIFVRTAAMKLAEAHPIRFAGGGRVTVSSMIHLADGTFLMAAASLDRRGDVQGLSVGFASIPRGKSGAVTEVEVARSINEALKPVCGIAHQEGLKALCEVIDPNLLVGREIICTFVVLKSAETVCQATVATRLTHDEPEPQVPADGS